MTDCTCVKKHSPKPAYTQRHHILPKSWGGSDTPANLISLCGTTHDAVHHLLNRMVKARGILPGKELQAYPTIARVLAIEAWLQYIRRNDGRTPTVYTSGERA